MIDLRPRIDVLDFFCGAGGTGRGFLDDGRFRVLVAANHNPLAVETYGTNNPTVDTRCADLHYIDPEDFPAARVLIATPECTNHSGAQAQRIYEQGPEAFKDPDDPEFAEYVRQERSRATMACSLRYARKHRPEFAIHENVVEVGWWGVQMPGKARGDGTTYQWWKNEWASLGYAVHELFLNACAFGAPQSRDRFLMVCRRLDVPAPNLVFTPDSWCFHCERLVEGRQTWKPRTQAWPLTHWGRLGRQYNYTCPRCRNTVLLASPGAHTVIDWTDLGETVGSRVDRGKPLADSTVERIEHGLKRLGGVEALIALTRAEGYGVDRGVSQPMPTLTTRADRAVAIPPAMVVELRSGGSRTSGQRPVTEPLGTVTSGGNHHYVATMPVAMWGKNNGGPTDTAYHPVTEPLGTITSRDSTSLVTLPEPPQDFDVNDVHFRMLSPTELQLAQTFPRDYRILGTKRQQVQQIGDAVPPVLAHVVAQRLGDALEGQERIAA